MTERDEAVRSVIGNCLGVVSRLSNMAISRKYSRDTVSELVRVLRYCVERLEESFKDDQSN